MTVFIDLDGVQADFQSRVIEVTGKPYDPKTSWKIIETILNFFYFLKPLPFKFSGDYIVLTALPEPTGLLTTAAKDKMDWVQRYLQRPCVCVPGWQYKKDFCNSPYDVLIDDSERNVNDWPGIGILYSPSMQGL